VLNYINLLQDILENGVQKDTERTGTGTIMVPGRMLRFDFQNGFPIITTKKMPFETILIELLWMISGNTNIRPLVTQGVHIWDEWPFEKFLIQTDQIHKYPRYSDEWRIRLKEFANRIKMDEGFAKDWGDLGPVYGAQWRSWKTTSGYTIDQLARAIQTIKTDPDDRRIIVSSWNPEDNPKMVLPPCHLYYQFFCFPKNRKLSLLMVQRSVDSFLGLPFNITQYALLLKMVAQVTDYEPKELIITLGDTHLYLNHLDQVKEQIKRIPLKLPDLIVSPDIKSIDDFRVGDFRLLNYVSHPRLRGEISV